MLFGPRKGKAANEGDLINKFFENYAKLKKEYGINIGWELINRNFSADMLEKITSIENPKNFERLKFLSDLI